MLGLTNDKDRGLAIKLITISLCVLELFIALCTFTYQQDERRHIETPITEEMAHPYIQNPGLLRTHERISENRRFTSSGNGKSYLLIREEVVVHPFPWKGWILLSIGIPIALAFLIVLITKAYLHIIEPSGAGEKKAPNAGESMAFKWVNNLNALSSVNIIWLMLLFVAVLFLFWYIPETLKFTGHAAASFLRQYWWIPIIAIVLLCVVVLFKIFLQYKLKIKAMEMDMEIVKFKYLQGHDVHPQIENQRIQALELMENDGGEATDAALN